MQQTTTTTDSAALITATEPETERTVPAPAPSSLAEVMSTTGVSFVDQSYSTQGFILDIERRWTLDLNPHRTALWGSVCQPLQETARVQWAPNGGTVPSAIWSSGRYEDVPADWGAFQLLTDGQVPLNEVTNMSRHAHKTSHLPTILGIAVPRAPDKAQACNVSVLFAHFTAARTAVLVVIVGERQETPSASLPLCAFARAYVIKAKGAWAEAFGPIPELDDDAALTDFPSVAAATLLELPATRHAQQPRNTLLLSSATDAGEARAPRWLHLDVLLRQTNVDLVMSQVSDAEMEDIVRTFHAQGRLRELRGWLTDRSAALNAAAASAIEDAAASSAPPSSGGSEGDSGGAGHEHSSLPALLARLRQTTEPAEREAIRRQLVSAQAHAAEATSAAASAARGALRSSRAFVGKALAAATELEKAGMSATVLGRLSNRAQRAATVERGTLTPMASLSIDADAVPRAECHVMLEEGPAALLVRKVPAELAEANTDDFSIDFPLCVGNRQTNDVMMPDVLGIADGTADTIERGQRSALGREETVVAIPIVNLDVQANESAVYERLCLAFTNGLKLGHVWQVALASILRALETKPWAAEGTPVGRLLHYLGTQIMRHAVIKQGSRLAMLRSATIGEAYAQGLATAELLRDYPVEGTVTCAAALMRFGSPAATPIRHHTACIQARAHLAVAQQYRDWIRRAETSGVADLGDCSRAALWRSIFDVRIGSDGSIAPIAGSHQLPTTWQGVLRAETIAQLERFAKLSTAAAVAEAGSAVALPPAALDMSDTTAAAAAAGGAAAAVSAAAAPPKIAITRRSSYGAPAAALESANSLVTPALALVVRSVLATILSPHISAARAVELPLAFHNALAAEFAPATVGSVSADEARAILSQWLVWARSPMRPMPPFATRYGPSLLFFYHGRTNGGMVTYMADGFDWSIDTEGEVEGEAERLERLAEYVRGVRTKLLHLEYGYSAEGRFVKEQTRSAPIHRAMSEQWGSHAEPAPLTGEFVSAVVAAMVARGTGNVNSDALEHDVAMLSSSLEQRGRPAADREPFRSVAARLKLELAGRTTDELSASDAAAAFWVPMENPRLQEMMTASRLARLALLEQHVERQRAAAASSAAAAASAAAHAASAPNSKMTANQLGRALTKLLRHTAEAAHVPIREDGYVRLDALLELDQLRLHGASVANVMDVVASDSKQRYGVVDEDGKLMIRANQGHTIAAVVAERLLEEMTDPSHIPLCIHGTYEATWERIANDALDRMQRNMIQMAVGLPDDERVTSGVRVNAEVLIYIDVGRAMAAGVRFFRSANNVICSPGPIPPRFFAHVTRRRDGKSLLASSFGPDRE